MTSPDEHANSSTGDSARGGADANAADVESAGPDDRADAEDDDLDSPDEGLLSRLAVIEDQPLEDRAAAFGQLYDGLRQQLEA